MALRIGGLRLGVCVGALGAPLLALQDPAPAPPAPSIGTPSLGVPTPVAPRFDVGGEGYVLQSAVYDPWGAVEVIGTRGDVVMRVMIPTAPFRRPMERAFEWGNPEGPVLPNFPGLNATIPHISRADADLVPESGTARVVVSRDHRVRFDVAGVLGGKPFSVHLDVPTTVRRLDPPVVFGPDPAPERVSLPRRVFEGDLVFCAMGNMGTGLPGQTQVARAVARAAKTTKASFVLALGDVFFDGSPAEDDPQWDALETLYAGAGLEVPFYMALGDRDWQRDQQGLVARAARDPRWHMPATWYSVEIDCHGEKVLLVAVDTTSMAKPVNRPEARRARGHLQNALRSDAKWKIVFGHHPFHSDGMGSDSLERSLEPDRFAPLAGLLSGADVYVAGGDHHLEVRGPIDGVVHVNSGGGGGPEAAAHASYSDDTVFATTGGGFTWFRCSGDALDIVCRGADGRPLYSQRLTK